MRLWKAYCHFDGGYDYIEVEAYSAREAVWKIKRDFQFDIEVITIRAIG